MLGDNTGANTNADSQQGILKRLRVRRREGQTPETNEDILKQV